MVANSESNLNISSIDWTEEELSLKEFSQKFNLPTVGKITKGQLEDINTSSISSSSSKSVCFWSKFKTLQISANCVKFKESRTSIPGSVCSKAVIYGPKFFISQDYDGYFEILSEEGRSVKCIESVAELAKMFPESCLIRESIKVYLSKTDDSDLVSDKTRTLTPGETLKLINSERSSPLIYSPSNHSSSSSSFSSSPSPSSSPTSSCSPTQSQPVILSSYSSYSFSSSSSSSPNPKSSLSEAQSSRYRYLKCQTSKGELVFLNLKFKGKFSPIAKEDSISGVHKVSTLLTKRLPLMVRLVHGSPIADFKSWIPEMRLFEVLEEDILVAMPLNQDYTGSSLVQVPLDLPLKLIGPKKSNLVLNHKVQCELNSRYLKTCPNLIQVTDNQVTNKESVAKEATDQCKQWERKPESTSFMVKNNSTQSDQNNTDDESGYDEIDQIYDYVRGFAPLPEKFKTFKENFKPNPPPLDTLPSLRRLSYPTIVCDLIYNPNLSSNKARLDKTCDLDIKYQRGLTRPIKRNQTPSYAPVRTPMRTNSTSKMNTLPSNGPNYLFVDHNNYSKPKVFIKSVSPSPNELQLGGRKFGKCIASCPNNNNINYKEPTQVNKWTYRFSGNRSVISSPLFNIRYKSLNNLHLIPPFITQNSFFQNSYNDTIASSNSGERVSSKSGNSGDSFKNFKPKSRRLSRPLSLSNLFWDITKNEASLKANQDPLVSQIVKDRLDCGQRRLNSSINNKKIGTLYL